MAGNDETDTKPAGGKAKNIIFFVLRILLAVGIIAWMVGGHYKGVIEQLEGFNYFWMLPICFLYIFHLVTCAWRWRALLKVQNINITLWDALSLTMKGLFCGLAIPAGAIGGDLAKVSFIASRLEKGRKFEGSFSVHIDRFTGMIALFSIAMVVIFFAWPILQQVKGIMQVAVWALIFGCFAGLSAGVFMFFHDKLEKIKPIAFFISIADKYSKGMYSRMSSALEIYRNSYKMIILCILASVIFIHLNMVVVVFMISKGVGVENASVTTVLNAVTIGNTAGLLPITPSGVGARDEVIKTLLAAGGMTINDAIAIPILYTAVILLFNILGGLFFVFDYKKKKRPENPV